MFWNAFLTLDNQRVHQLLVQTTRKVLRVVTHFAAIRATSGHRLCSFVFLMCVVRVNFFLIQFIREPPKVVVNTFSKF